MIINGNEHFQKVARQKFVEWYNRSNKQKIDYGMTFVVWCCKTLQNYKCLVSSNVDGDGIYAEYTYNGDKQELYEDIYKKLVNTCHK